MTKTRVISSVVSPTLLLFSITLYSQQCEVDIASLKGNYSGDCKKSKAHGKGKALGIDSYEGEFKNGVPDGQGTYVWANKNQFTGKYVKGLREGNGKMTIKHEGQDSIIEGFWKKDVYIGKHEKPWRLHSKTGSVRDVQVEYIPDKLNRVKVIITSTTSGITDVGGRMPSYRVDNVILLTGSFLRQTNLETHLKSTETTFNDVQYPFRIKLQMAREEIEIEFFEPGSYSVNISING